MEPELYARALLDRFAITGIPDVRQIAAALKVPILERALERCEGMLVRVKGTARGAIAVRTSIHENSRKLFTIAHELGHLLLPGHDDLGVCAPETIENWSSDLRAKEREANAFAAELLMPAAVVLHRLGPHQPSFGVIEQLAESFKTSLTASGYRFASLTTHPVALVWSTAGRTRWAKRSGEFGGWLRLREQLDSRTFAADLFRGAEVPFGAHKVPADAWLETPDPSITLSEESRFLPNYNAVITLLCVMGQCSADDDDGLLEALDPSDFSIERRRWPRGRR